ncbi:MAG: hypothetical protein LW875_06135 [Proteobacteria bacterium]|nr:hypothetical protein [Pseudomonadota bacterium]
MVNYLHAQKNRPLVPLLLIILLPMMTGCSRTDLALKYADTFVALEIKDQFDLSGNQKDKAEDLSTKLTDDLKKEFLPLVSDELRNLSKEIDSLDAAQANAFLKLKAERFRSIGVQFYPLVARQMVAFSEILTERNWKAFKTNFEERNQEILSDTKKSRTTDNLEFFIGSLTPEQEKLVDEFTSLFPQRRDLRVQNRIHSLAEFEKTMGSFSPKSFKEAALLFLENPQRYQLKKNEEAWKSREQALIELLEKVFRIMTPKQKNHFKEKCQELALQLLR